MSAERDLAIARAVLEAVVDDNGLPGYAGFPASRLRAIIAEVDVSLAAPHSSRLMADKTDAYDDARPQAAEPPSDLLVDKAAFADGWRAAEITFRLMLREEKQRAAGIILRLCHSHADEASGGKCWCDSHMYGIDRKHMPPCEVARAYLAEAP